MCVRRCYKRNGVRPVPVITAKHQPCADCKYAGNRFQGNRAVSGGGALQAYTCKLFSAENRFEENTCTSGGACARSVLPSVFRVQEPSRGGWSVQLMPGAEELNRAPKGFGELVGVSRLPVQEAPRWGSGKSSYRVCATNAWRAPFSRVKVEAVSA